MSYLENEKKLFGFNIPIKLKKRLQEAASKKFTTQSGLLTQILVEWLDNYEGIVKEKEEVWNAPKATPEELAKDWEWRKQQVQEGKFPIYMAKEDPTMSDTEGPAVFIKPGETVSDTGEIIPAPKTQEDIDFEESVATSVEE